MCMKFRTFWKKRRVSYPNYYRNYCIRKRCLLKRLKGLSSAHHSVINVLTGSKHCWSLHGTTIFLFLLKRLIGLASAHHSVINVLTGSKHCWSQHGTTIFLFLLKRLKGLSSAHHSVINLLTGSKHCWSLHGATILLFFHEFEIIELENVCLSHIWNPQTVC